LYFFTTLPDVPGDRISKKRTLAVLYGEKFVINKCIIKGVCEMNKSEILEVKSLFQTMLDNNLDILSYGLAPNPNGFCYEIQGKRPSDEFLNHIGSRLDALNSKMCR